MRYMNVNRNIDSPLQIFGELIEIHSIDILIVFEKDSQIQFRWKAYDFKTGNSLAMRIPNSNEYLGLAGTKESLIEKLENWLFKKENIEMYYSAQAGFKTLNYVSAL
jgi:activator of HSP90 ATPase